MHYFSTNFLLLLLIQAFLANCCIEHERDALLEFKAGVKDKSSRLVSWRGKNCCNWAGIRCSNRTGRVVKLNLRNTNFDLDDYEDFIFDWNHHSLTGKISPSLVVLSDLKHLDLSFNNFSGNKFPKFIGTFRNLKYLNLSYTCLSGMIPPQLGNLSRLLYIDLSYDNTYSGSILNTDTWWLSNLRSLKHMDMSGVNFKDSNGWVESLNKLASLEVLILFNNNLTQTFNALTFVNFTSLKVLYISDQNFNTTIPNWIGNLTSLNKLALDYNSFDGMVPPLHSLTKLTFLSLLGNNIEGDIRELILGKLSNYTLGNLEYLDISFNNFAGNLIGWIENMTSVTHLGLSFNNLSGTIPIDIENLTNLVYLDLSSNSLTGLLSETHLTSLLKLKYLYLTDTNITILLGSEWKSMDLSNNNLIGEIPPEIVALAALLNLNLSHNHLIGDIPLEIGNMTSLESLDLHMNNLSGSIPQSITALNFLEWLNFSYNNLSGSIPNGHQLQTLDDPSIYSGNPHLCGPPLEVSCGRSERFPQNDSNSDSNSKNIGDRDKWLYLFIEFGFVAGLLVVFFILLFKVKWRYTYFQMVDSVFGTLYVMGTLTFMRLMKEQI